MASSINAFGLQLLGQVSAAEAVGTNVLLCPLSVAAALSMVATGATLGSPCAAQARAPPWRERLSGVSAVRGSGRRCYNTTTKPNQHLCTPRAWALPAPFRKGYIGLYRASSPKIPRLVPA